MSQYLFAYGTLQSGCAPPKIAHLAAKLRPAGAAYVRGVLYHLGRYPGAIANPASNCRIAGTVLELPGTPETLRQLDAYEGFDPLHPETSEFVRELQTAEFVGGGSLTCWFYRYNGRIDPTRIIDNGNWLTRARRDVL
jgi:gamma-glutamylcyclotransferase (GGCT)/AIG2-like uncharacterized protein YtfP